MRKDALYMASIRNASALLNEKESAKLKKKAAPQDWGVSEATIQHWEKKGAPIGDEQKLLTWLMEQPVPDQFHC